MSNVGLQMSPESGTPRGPRRRVRSWAAILLSLAVLGAIAFGVTFALDRIPALGGGPEDYAGQGSGSVVVEVAKGQTLAQIGQTLKAAGVVASVDAWLAAAKDEPASSAIAPGLYDMRSQMSGEAAVKRMIDPNSRLTNKLLLREGLRLWESFATISKATGIPVKELQKVAASGRIGLPAYARNNAEGFMFPATYELEPKETAQEILTRLVDRWAQAAADVGLEEGARRLGLSPYEALIVASLVQAEGHPDDFDKVARVIYNRLDQSTWGGTYGLLQMDATLNYALKKSEINLTNEELKTDSPFNTYKYPGLPPTPINSPGEAAMRAALNPAEGDWLYYVTVNPDTGQTKFTNDYDEFLRFKEELSQWHSANP